MNRSAAPRARLLAPTVAAALLTFPVVVVTGARQTGKTTLVSRGALARGRSFRSLDDYEFLDQVARRPEFVFQDAQPLTLDEVQRAPNVLGAIKQEVGRNGTPGRFLLTGWANPSIMRGVAESLAGHAAQLTLLPMTESEKDGNAHAGPWDGWLLTPDARSILDSPKSEGAESGWLARAMAGGHPAPALGMSEPARSQWFDGYVRTYLERDLQDIASISSLSDFRRLMRLASLRVGTVLNQSELAREAALTQTTAHRYLNILETSCQIVRLQPYPSSRTKRLVKTPKLYWTDTGLAACLSSVVGPSAADPPKIHKALLENLVLNQILAWRETVVPRPNVHYWRTHGGVEVDFVLECGSRLLPIEVKTARRVRRQDAAGLEAFFREHHENAPFGIVLYDGDEAVPLTERTVALPLRVLWDGAGFEPQLSA